VCGPRPPARGPRPRARCRASVGRWTWYASSRTDVGRGPARSHARLDPRPRRVFRYKRRSTMSRSRHKPRAEEAEDAETDLNAELAKLAEAFLEDPQRASRAPR